MRSSGFHVGLHFVLPHIGHGMDDITLVTLVQTHFLAFVFRHIKTRDVQARSTARGYPALQVFAK
jgi:hypothetical protein